jgi:hypothetical protein
MKSQSFGNFQIGIVDNPTIEDKGGFEFASGMDIFSEPGVLKACNVMAEVTYGASATPAAVPLWMTEAIDSLGAVRGYVAAGSKLLESTDGSTFNLFRTNTNGTIKGLGAWSGQVVYVADGKIGLVQIGVSASASDSYYSYGSYTASDFYPVIIQGGTLKIGAGRYISSMDESLTVTPDVFKLPDTYRTLSLVNHFSRIYMGTKLALGAGSATVSGSSVFSWGGTILSTGSALPDNAYELRLRGMPALFSDSRYLYGFPDHQGEIPDRKFLACTR